ncbi:MAG: ABC transporter permease [Chloroflexota bacterium]
MVFDNLRLSISELLINKLRAFLTVLGITIGIAAVVLLLSLGQSVQAYIANQFLSLGTNTIRVSASPDSNGRLEPLTEDLANKLNDPSRLPAVKVAMPETTGNYPVVYENNEFNVGTTGATTDYPEVESRTLKDGRFFTSDEYNASAQVALIGTTTATNLFGTDDPIGQTIRVQDVLFQVIGVFNTSGVSDDLVVIPLTAFKARLNNARTATGESTVSTILVLAADVNKVTDATTQVTTALREERGITGGESDNFRTFTASTILDSLTSIISILTIFLGVVAGISLLVGGINIMNIMLVTITERTREIGLRKAVGARSEDIVSLFLIQAIVLTLIGGVIGVLIAITGAEIITHLVAGFTVVVQVSNIIFAVVISAAIGIFFGVYPASRAARLNPIDALRYE